jgi:hypothetical protein
MAETMAPRRGQGPWHPTNDALVNCKIICESVTHLSTLSSWEHHVAMMHGQNHIAPMLNTCNIRLVPFGFTYACMACQWSHARRVVGPPRQLSKIVLTADLINLLMSTSILLSMMKLLTLPSLPGLWCWHNYGLVKRLHGLHLSSGVGCVPQHGWWPWLLVDLSYSGVNVDTLKLAPTWGNAVWPCSGPDVVSDMTCWPARSMAQPSLTRLMWVTASTRSGLLLSQCHACHHLTNSPRE